MNYDNIMSFCEGGTAYLARCGWGQGIAGPPLRGPAIPCPQPHLARYAVPPERKLMMLIAIGKTMGKSPFSYIGKCLKLLVLARCGWGQGIADPGRGGRRSPVPQPHLARYVVPPERKLMMLIAIGKTMGKSC